MKKKNLHLMMLALSALLFNGGCRTLIMEIDRNDTMPLPPTVELDDEVFTLQSIYQTDGGININIQNEPFQMFHFGNISDSELDFLDFVTRDNPILPISDNIFNKKYFVHALVLDAEYSENEGNPINDILAIDGDKMAGMIFKKENCSSFAIFNPVKDLDEKRILAAYAHELGHCFNLHHEDDTEANLIMAPILAQSNTLRFSNESQRHLKKHPSCCSRPGLARFYRISSDHSSIPHPPGTCICSRLACDCTTYAECDSPLGTTTIISSGINDLNISIESEKHLFESGEPIFISLKIKNTSYNSIEVYKKLLPKHGQVFVQIQTPEKIMRYYSSLSEIDWIDSPNLLQPNEEIWQTMPIFFDSWGWVFKDTGTYKIKLLFSNQIVNKGRNILLSSNEIQINIHETNNSNKLLFANEESSSQIGKFMIWQSGDHLEKGISTLDSIIQFFPRTTLANYANFYRGISLSKNFRNFLTGQLREPNYLVAMRFFNEVDKEKLPIYLRIQQYLAEARCNIALERISVAEQNIIVARGLISRYNKYKSFEPLISVLLK